MVRMMPLPPHHLCLVWWIARATYEQSGGGSCFQYSCSVPFPSSLQCKYSQYSFYLSAISAVSVKFLPVADRIHCICGWNFDKWFHSFFHLNLGHPIPLDPPAPVLEPIALMESAFYSPDVFPSSKPSVLKVETLNGTKGANHNHCCGK